jgi:hypothetical protein
LPDLGTKLLSREAGVAQGALQELQGLQDSFKFFTDIVGENLTTGDGTTKSLYEKLPELEQGLLDNVFLMKNFIEQVNTSLVSLREKRVEFEALLDVDPDLVKSQQKIMEELQPKIETAGSGLDDIRSSIGGFGGVNSQDGAEGADTMNTTGGGLEPRFKTLQREVDQLRQTLMGPAGNTDGGQIGAANKIIGYTYPVPGDISETVAQTAAVGRKLLAQRLEEIGVYDVENLLKNRPSFDDLARLEMGELVSRDIVNTAKTLLQNETAQQFERMKLNGRTFVKAHEIYLAEMNFQNDLTVEGVTNPMIIKDAQYLRTEENGEALIYHTTDLVIKILTPKIGSADSRNVLVYKKTEAEKGLGNFVPAYGNPDFLATLMTSRPENSAFAHNALYGVTGKNIQANHPGVNRLQ